MIVTIMNDIRGLVLIGQPWLTELVENIAIELGCKIEVDLDVNARFDFLILDSFFFQSQMCEYLKQRNPNQLVVLIASENEMARLRDEQWGSLDDIMVMPEGNADSARKILWERFMGPKIHGALQGLYRKFISEYESASESSQPWAVEREEMAV